METGAVKHLPPIMKAPDNRPVPQTAAPLRGVGFRAYLSAAFFFLYPQSQYGPPEASVYLRTKTSAPPASLIV